MSVNIDRVKKRELRVRAKISPSKDRLRIRVFRSNKHFYAQVISDDKGEILASASSMEIKKELKESKRTEEAKLVGQTLAKKLSKKGIKKGVLDRRNYSYKGRVKAFTEGLREGGIEV